VPGWKEIALRTLRRSFLLGLVEASGAAGAATIAAVLASTSAICAWRRRAWS
jgi:hypothetical protein